MIPLPSCLINFTQPIARLFLVSVQSNAMQFSFLTGAGLKICSASQSCCTAEMESMLGAFTTAQFKSTVERNGGTVVDVFRNKGKRIDGKFELFCDLSYKTNGSIDLRSHHQSDALRKLRKTSNCGL